MVGVEGPGGHRTGRSIRPGYEARPAESPDEEIGVLQKRWMQSGGVGRSMMGSAPVRTRRMGLKSEQQGLGA